MTHIPQKFDFTATQGDKVSHMTFNTPMASPDYDDINIKNIIQHCEKVFGVEDYKTILRDLTKDVYSKASRRLVRRSSTDTVRIKMTKTPIIT